MGNIYRWQLGALKGRERGKMVSDSVGYNHTDQEVKT